jgi:hypothetical protein
LVLGLALATAAGTVAVSGLVAIADPCATSTSAPNTSSPIPFYKHLLDEPVPDRFIQLLAEPEKRRSLEPSADGVEPVIERARYNTQASQR